MEKQLALYLRGGWKQMAEWRAIFRAGLFSALSSGSGHPKIVYLFRRNWSVVNRENSKLIGGLWQTEKESKQALRGGNSPRKRDVLKLCYSLNNEIYIHKFSFAVSSLRNCLKFLTDKSQISNDSRKLLGRGLEIFANCLRLCWF